MKTSKTTLLHLLRHAYQLALKANQPHSAPADELIDQWAENQSRRRFLRSAGQLSLMAGGLSLLDACSPAKDIEPEIQRFGDRAARKASDIKVAIVGAGIAGLNTAHTLQKRSFTNWTIYEASNRVGGRIYSKTNLLGTGLTTELGGEFIDSSHKDMFYLIKDFNLKLLDMQSPSEQALIKDAYFFNGQHFTLKQVVDAFRQIAPRMQADIDSLPDSIDFQTRGIAATLDKISISDYLTKIGATGWLKELLEVAYETEYGLVPNVQSCINLLFLISTDTAKGNFDIFGDSDERYKVVGGNQKIIDKLISHYQNRIEIGRTLKAVKKNGSKIELVFEGGPSVLADFVVLTLPFTKLRQVDIQVPLDPVKKKSIQELGYGKNAKLMMGFNTRHWRTLGYTGYVFSDNTVQSGWDNSQLQPGTAGGYTVYLGGNKGVQVGDGSVQQQVKNYLPKLNQIFPGVEAQYNGVAERFHWPTHPYTLGSYACYKVGQWTTIGGAESLPVGSQILFAGEHCSVDYQGYMNGGAETGRQAANEIIQALLD
ncbi:flavin monoamine oxidase family protein [Larkinella soli]|uniref:flavin monoamine oxidase family protein n=1 Tax=Larkinella soli TaxID=1770527 RepID=UPI000FFB9CFC|nr:NAD(P)/FAD-dependent oxidoreductase [Larkinella soli]